MTVTATFVSNTSGLIALFRLRVGDLHKMSTDDETSVVFQKQKSLFHKFNVFIDQPQLDRNSFAGF